MYLWSHCQNEVVEPGDVLDREEYGEWKEGLAKRKGKIFPTLAPGDDPPWL